MSVRREVGFALLLGAALTIAIVTGRRGTEQGPLFDWRLSTLRAGPEGARALYDVLAALGRPVERRRRPFFDLTRDSVRRPALLVVLDPPIELETAELRELAAFVREGGHVLAAGRGGEITACAGWRLEPRPGPLRPDTLTVAAPSPGLALPAVAHVLRRGARGRDEAGRPEDMPKRPFAEDDKSDTGCESLMAAGEDTLLATTDGRPVVLRLRYPGGGGGSITLAADADYFRNRVWRAGAVPRFALPLLTPPPGRRGRVSWDEYHQGFGRTTSLGRAMIGWLVRSPAGWAIFQLVAVALAALAVAAVRFGPAQGVLERRRRSPLEHLEALAAGLEGAGGVDTAVDLTVAGLRRRLSRTAGGPLPAGDGRQWLTGLELALPSARGREAVRRLRVVLTEPGGAERVLAAAQAVEDVWEELRPRTTRD